MWLDEVSLWLWSVIRPAVTCELCSKLGPLFFSSAALVDCPPGDRGGIPLPQGGRAYVPIAICLMPPAAALLIPLLLSRVPLCAGCVIEPPRRGRSPERTLGIRPSRMRAFNSV